jgi:hypothetical protein
MAAKKEQPKYVDVLDVFWDGWFNSFKTFQSIQNGVEQNAIQAFESQKEWINSSKNQLSKIEDETKKLATEWKSKVQEVVNNAPTDFVGANLSDWADKFEEVGLKSQSVAFSPGKSSLELLSKSHAHLESTFKNALDQQQKNRAEVISAMEGFVDQLKQTQNGVLKSFDLYNPLIAK